MTLQYTSYLPGGSAVGSAVWSSAWFFASTLPLPALTCLPAAFLTIRLENTGSISPSNHTLTCLGAVSTVAPTCGDELSGNAWADASGAAANANRKKTIQANERAMGQSGSVKQRRAESVRREVIEVKIEAEHHADRVAGALVHRHQQFDAPLEVMAQPDHPGRDVAGGLAMATAIEAGLHWQFDDRDHVVEGRLDACVLHEVLQIRDAVLQRQAPVQHAWFVVCVGQIQRNRTGERERPQPACIRLPKALAEVERGGPYGKVVPYGAAPGVCKTAADRERTDGFRFGVTINLPYTAQFEVAPAVHRR